MVMASLTGTRTDIPLKAAGMAISPQTGGVIFSGAPRLKQGLQATVNGLEPSASPRLRVTKSPATDSHVPLRAAKNANAMAPRR